jgi:hypothetical protein
LDIFIWDYWAVANNGEPSKSDGKPKPAIHGTVKIEGPGIDLRAEVKCGPGGRDDCSQRPAAEPKPIDPFAHTPKWLKDTVEILSGTKPEPIPSAPPGYENSPPKTDFQKALVYSYLAVGLLLLVSTWLLRPNTNPLHQLYRARLAKAFLFDPTRVMEGANKSAVDSKIDPVYEPIGTMPLSALAENTTYAPYHLINATLNVQGSDYANRRGRNSDFFLFSPMFIGSQATGYARTRDMERETRIDLATAMTISGAAFSPNAGASSIVPLRATLALLNVRTGTG